MATAPAMAAEKSGVKKPDDDFLKKVRERFQQSLSASTENRNNYVRDVEFSCADDQWDPHTKSMRGAYRPALTFNHLNGVIKQIIGDYRQNKIAMKVLPASGEASEDIADILAGLLRNIEAQSNADMVYTNALECSARGGFGYWRILPQYAADDVFDQDLAILPIHNPLTVYFDPAARLITREDANWCFVTEMIGKEEFESRYPDAEMTGFDLDGDSTMADWTTQDDIRVAEYFEKEKYQARLVAFSNGMVMEVDDDAEIEAMAQVGITAVKERESTRTQIRWSKITGVEVLEEQVFKIPFIPVVPAIGEEINKEGKVLTRSAIFYAKDAQRMLNYQKSTAIEIAALAPKAPWKGTAKHFEGYEDQWDNAHLNPLARLTYNPDAEAPQGPERIQPTPQPISEIALAGDANDEIKATTGLYDASLGARSNEISGVAIGERQQEGNTATYIFIDNLKAAIKYTGRILLAWIPHIYDAERVIRVLDLEGNVQMESVNQQQHDPMTGVTQVLNCITVGKYDVIIDTGPSFASQKREAVKGMIQLAQVDPTLMQKAGDLVIKNMDFNGANEISARYKRFLPPQVTVDPDSPEGQKIQAQAQQQQQQAEQTQQQLIGAKLQTVQSKQQSDMAKSQAQMAKANAEMVKASSDVIEAKLGVVKSVNDAKAQHVQRIHDVAMHVAPKPQPSIAGMP